jgi:hypothetical protein
MSNRVLQAPGETRAKVTGRKADFSAPLRNDKEKKLYPDMNVSWNRVRLVTLSLGQLSIKIIPRIATEATKETYR